MELSHSDAQNGSLYILGATSPSQDIQDLYFLEKKKTTSLTPSNRVLTFQNSIGYKPLRNYTKKGLSLHSSGGGPKSSSLCPKTSTRFLPLTSPPGLYKHKIIWRCQGKDRYETPPSTLTQIS